MTEDENATQTTVKDKLDAPKVEEVVEEMKGLEPFIPEGLMDLHKAPAGDRKHISRYRKGSVGPLIPNSFSVNSGTNSIPGLRVGLREYSHVTRYNTWEKENTYTPRKRATVSVDFNRIDNETMQRASDLLSFPEIPEGYEVRKDKSTPRVEGYDGSASVSEALEANFSNGQTKPAPNRFAVMYVNELGKGNSVQVHVDIGGGMYSETRYYDKK